jgi:hypothetical protein
MKWFVIFFVMDLHLYSLLDAVEFSISVSEDQSIIPATPNFSPHPMN